MDFLTIGTEVVATTVIVGGVVVGIWLHGLISKIYEKIYD